MKYIKQRHGHLCRCRLRNYSSPPIFDINEITQEKIFPLQSKNPLCVLALIKSDDGWRCLSVCVFLFVASDTLTLIQYGTLVWSFILNAQFFREPSVSCLQNADATYKSQTFKIINRLGFQRSSLHCHPKLTACGQRTKRIRSDSARLLLQGIIFPGGGAVVVLQINMTVVWLQFEDLKMSISQRSEKIQRPDLARPVATRTDITRSVVAACEVAQFNRILLIEHRVNTGYSLT